jgi:hypothetical protein
MFWNKKVKVDETPKYRHWITIKTRGGEINLDTVREDEVATWEPFKEFYNCISMKVLRYMNFTIAVAAS